MATKSDFRRRFHRAKTAKTRRRIWCEALESELWRQGYGRLHDRDGGHCCLGVANDLGVPAPKDNYVTCPVMLDSSEARDLLGLTDGYGSCGEGSPDLTELNDEKRWGFKRIAAFIRKEPRGLLAKEG